MRAGDPAVVVDAAIAQHLEILRDVPCRRMGSVECVDEARALDWRLLHAVEHRGFFHPGRLEDRRHDVDDVAELTAETPLVLDPLGPGNDEAIPRATEMRGDLLGPL